MNYLQYVIDCCQFLKLLLKNGARNWRRNLLLIIISLLQDLTHTIGLYSLSLYWRFVSHNMQTQKMGKYKLNSYILKMERLLFLIIYELFAVLYLVYKNTDGRNDICTLMTIICWLVKLEDRLCRSTNL